MVFSSGYVDKFKNLFDLTFVGFKVKVGAF
jgi:hypothetical protein